MATVSQAFSIADAHHQANRISEAEQIYRPILAIEPTHAEAWHRLGVIAHQMCQYEIAIEHISRALTLKPDAPGVNYNLAFTFQTLGKDQEALDH
jgi:protein O-GlcNAc transferase